MADLQKVQRACRVFLARLPTVHVEDVPEVLWRMADQLEWLEQGARNAGKFQVALELHSARFRGNSYGRVHS